jgi:hypothetical protein
VCRCCALSSNDLAWLHATNRGVASDHGARRANFTTDTRACQPPHDKYPFCDTSRSFSDRVGDLISRIPDDAKPHLLTARGWPQGNIRNLSDIGVPAFDWGLNCIHGTQSTCKGDICPTSFPNPNSLGASWNMTNTAVMGGYIGRETRALWLAGATETSAWSGRALIGLDCWSPNINVSPLLFPRRPQAIISC